MLNYYDIWWSDMQFFIGIQVYEGTYGKSRLVSVVSLVLITAIIIIIIIMSYIPLVAFL